MVDGLNTLQPIEWRSVSSKERLTVAFCFITGSLLLDILVLFLQWGLPPTTEPPTEPAALQAPTSPAQAAWPHGSLESVIGSHQKPTAQQQWRTCCVHLLSPSADHGAGKLRLCSSLAEECVRSQSKGPSIVTRSPFYEYDAGRGRRLPGPTPIRARLRLTATLWPQAKLCCWPEGCTGRSFSAVGLAASCRVPRCTHRW